MAGEAGFEEALLGRGTWSGVPRTVAGGEDMLGSSGDWRLRRRLVAGAAVCSGGDSEEFREALPEAAEDGRDGGDASGIRGRSSRFRFLLPVVVV